MINYFEKCQHCVPPERHPGCQDHCEHYETAKARLEADKAKANKTIHLKYYINERQVDNKDGIAKYNKRRPKNRYHK